MNEATYGECPECKGVHFHHSRCKTRPPLTPPDEPDSGVQDKEICFCGQLITKHDQSHDPRPFKEVLGEQKKRVCSLCGVRFGEDVKVCPTDGHPIISVLTDAPADHVEHVRRKGREAALIWDIAKRISHISTLNYHDFMNRVVGLLNELTERTLLSEHRSTSPATVSASPDSAQTSFEEHLKHVSNFLNELYCTMIDPLVEGEMTVREMCDAILKQARGDREKLASGSGSEVSGVAKDYGSLLRLVLDTMPKDWFISPTRRASHVLSNVAEFLEEIPAPSAPSSTEQKGT